MEEATDNKCIYLDWNATTPLFQEVKQTIINTLDSFGNPSSSHTYGQTAKQAVDLARQQVARMINAEPNEIYFCSCGTECDNWAIFGTVMKARREKKLPPDTLPHIVSSKIEHPAILECLKQLKSLGLLDYTLVNVSKSGIVSPEVVEKAIKPGSTVLITIMHTNNEIGTQNPIKEIASIAHRHNIPIHTDAAQSAGKVLLDVKDMGVDMMTLVGHKMGAPKGVAALYIKTGITIDKLLHGGGQEFGKRAGTENILLISAFGAAANYVTENLKNLARGMHQTTQRLKDNLTLSKEVGGFGLDEGQYCINGPLEYQPGLPNTLSISFKNVSAAELLRNLSDKLAASAGAACHSSSSTDENNNNGKPSSTISHVLEAIGLTPEYAMGTLRLSVGRCTTFEDVDNAAELILAEVQRQLKKRRGRN